MNCEKLKKMIEELRDTLEKISYLKVCLRSEEYLPVYVISNNDVSFLSEVERKIEKMLKEVIYYAYTHKCIEFKEENK